MGNKKKSESGFLVQGSILAIASIISRIIGLLYRVPLRRSLETTETVITVVHMRFIACCF